MTTPRASWDLNLSDESDNEVENTANVNSEANAFANLFNGSGEKGIDNVAPLDSEIQDLLRDVEKSIEFGPEIMAEVAEGFNKTMCRPLSKETSDNLKNNFKIPINCKPFVIPKMNQEIWSHLPGPARFIDLNMQQNQFSLGIGLNALAQIANEVAKNASNIPKEVKISILKLAIDGGNILGDQIQSISKKRRLEVKKHINSEYHGICNSQIPVSEFLFGSDLNETLKASKTASNFFKLESPKALHSPEAAVRAATEGRNVSTSTLANKQLSSTINSTLSKPEEVASHQANKNQAGQLKYFVNEWQKITKDRFVLRTIQGYKIPFESEPQQLSEPNNPQMSETESKFINDAISELVISSAIKISEEEAGQFISPVFTVAKSDGGRRFVLNLKKLNTFIFAPHFKLEDIRMAKQLVSPGCYMTVIDQKDAYYMIPIALESQKYLKFRWNGVLYAYTCLCFAVKYGQLYTRQLEIEKTLALENSNNSFLAKMMLSNEAIKDLNWWLSHVQSAKKGLRKDSFDLRITTDASLTGWGAECNGQTTRGFWSILENRAHPLSYQVTLMSAILSGQH
ncbi:Gag-Pro-Pol polyprotein [Folsomia candida]|uniref:Gag-Pro-Pol polyprotein n=1 Tax=Folsomia candida TaxID=158441 RepID=A0A226D3H4_FOLCA|nr:Gag-Pro-Pol polyprotein [Folsomia candida]